MAVTAAQVARERARLGLPPDSASDAIWANRPNATLSQVSGRLREKRATMNVDFVQTDPASPGAASAAPAEPVTAAAPIIRHPAPAAVPLVIDPRTGNVTHMTEAELNATLAQLEADPNAVIHDATTRGGSGRPSQAASAAAEAAANRRSFAEQAALLYPWLSPTLISVFTDAYVDTGDTGLALAEVRNGKGRAEYDQVFVGNRREDGTLRFTETQYLAQMQSYANAAADFGLNPSALQHLFPTLLQNEKSPNEYRAQLAELNDRLVNAPDEIKQAARERFGLPGQSDAELLAVAHDPTIGNEILNRSLSIAEVVGTGRRFGFDRSQDRASRLVDAGVGEAQAVQLFSQAAQRLPSLSGISQRAGEGEFTIGQFEDFAALQDAQTTRLVQRVLRREASLFSPSATVRARGEGLIGLGRR